MNDLLHFQVDAASGVPAYRQLMDQVRYYVASGALAPGDKLPSIRSLAKRMHLNPTTITKAYSELQHLGVVVNEQGKGVFVADRVASLTDDERFAELRRLATGFASAARQLGATPEEAARALRAEMERLEPAQD